MSVLKNVAEFSKTTEFIFSQAAGRLKKRKLELNLTDAEIAGTYDIKIVNRILNGRRTRNNVSLISPAYVQPLVEKLGLSSDYELFWGNPDDEEFVEAVFFNLLTDILEESGWRDDSCADIVIQVLLDDVRFARIQPVVMPAFEYIGENGEYMPISPLRYVNDDEQVSFAERRKIRNDAISRLWANTRPIKLFTDFFAGNLTFSKLDKRLDGFIEKSLLPYMKDNLPTEKSLGLRVFTIVSADIRNHVELELVNQTRTAAGFDKYLGGEYAELLQSLTSAGQGYIGKIEKLQARLDELLRKEKFG